MSIIIGRFKHGKNLLRHAIFYVTIWVIPWIENRRALSSPAARTVGPYVEKEERTKMNYEDNPQMLIRPQLLACSAAARFLFTWWRPSPDGYEHGD